MKAKTNIKAGPFRITTIKVIKRGYATSGTQTHGGNNDG